MAGWLLRWRAAGPALGGLDASSCPPLFLTKAFRPRDATFRPLDCQALWGRGRRATLGGRAAGPSRSSPQLFLSKAFRAARRYLFGLSFVRPSGAAAGAQPLPVRAAGPGHSSPRLFLAKAFRAAIRSVPVAAS